MVMIGVENEVHSYTKSDIQICRKAKIDMIMALKCSKQGQLPAKMPVKTKQLHWERETFTREAEHIHKGKRCQ